MNMDTLTHLPDVITLAAMARGDWGEFHRRIAASGAPTNEQLAPTYPNPFGAYVNADGQIVVDDYTADITRMPEIVRAFARSNEGYWIEDVYDTPGWSVTGGAVSYTITSADDHFLTPGKEPAPRAPGAEAPLLAGTKRRPILKAPENLSGRVEVTDEARRSNNIIEVRRTFLQTANTFARIMQEIGEETLDLLIDAEDRHLWGGTGTFTSWDEAEPISMLSADPVANPRPSSEFARVRRTFMEERGGVTPNSLMWSPEDAEHFDRVYEERGDAVLARYGITNTYTSLRLDPGTRRYFAKGQVGVLGWEKPMDTEEVREGIRKTDVYVLDGSFLFIANGADAILEVQDTTDPTP
jgi:hypothetical protein